jgi:hypothetical protein
MSSSWLLAPGVLFLTTGYWIAPTPFPPDIWGVEAGAKARGMRQNWWVGHQPIACWSCPAPSHLDMATDSCSGEGSALPWAKGEPSIPVSVPMSSLKTVHSRAGTNGRGAGRIMQVLSPASVQCRRSWGSKQLKCCNWSLREVRGRRSPVFLLQPHGLQVGRLCL